MEEYDIAYGQKLKKIRKANNMTLKEVAEKVPCSVPFLSMLENGRTGITLDKLQRLLGLYNITVTDLVEDDDISRVVPAGTGSHLDHEFGESHAEAELLCHDIQNKQMRPMLVTIPPHSKIGPVTQKGKEYAYILSGHIKLTLSNPSKASKEYYYLNTGDSITIEHGLFRTIENISDEIVQLLVVVSQM
ncbi:helix-turn-helix domain-containing protein [Eubacterium oxidoreducens]|uniref:Transcriptional regulator, XRE family with cupin sensor n=1 Tax=Eubacterium oxidoreducens TaxID=1732 RepID=A0A1G6CEA4_EUBOX|nr:XRE family transcriptional regulator [Eubacterium oxidoreducens]SDB31165.1 transcriptional regulator, XRE family with cupin sensor [Eubacterium oxidoreducens]